MRTTILFFALALSAAAEFRTWTSADGRKADLELESVSEKNGEKVGHFLMRNGRSASVNASRLSKEDAVLLNKLKPSLTAKGNVVADRLPSNDVRKMDYPEDTENPSSGTSSLPDLPSAMMTTTHKPSEATEVKPQQDQRQAVPSAQPQVVAPATVTHEETLNLTPQEVTVPSSSPAVSRKPNFFMKYPEVWPLIGFCIITLVLLIGARVTTNPSFGNTRVGSSVGKENQVYQWCDGCHRAINYTDNWGKQFFEFSLYCSSCRKWYCRRCIVQPKKRWSGQGVLTESTLEAAASYNALSEERRQQLYWETCPQGHVLKG